LKRGNMTKITMKEILSFIRQHWRQQQQQCCLFRHLKRFWRRNRWVKREVTESVILPHSSSFTAWLILLEKEKNKSRKIAVSDESCLSLNSPASFFFLLS
jgi:hypothetical protein